MLVPLLSLLAGVLIGIIIEGFMVDRRVKKLREKQKFTLETLGRKK